MDKIICNFSLFDMEQTVYVYISSTNSYEPIGKCSLEDLGKTIADVCFARNISNVHLYGHDKYVEGILKDIDLYSGCSAYSIGMINVEVN